MELGGMTDPSSPTSLGLDLPACRGCGLDGVVNGAAVGSRAVGRLVVDTFHRQLALLGRGTNNLARRAQKRLEKRPKCRDESLHGINCFQLLISRIPSSEIASSSR